MPADRDRVGSAVPEARYYPQPERQLSPWQKRSPSMSATATERQRPKVPGMSAYSDRGPPQRGELPSLCLDHEAVVYSRALQRMPFTPPYSALPQQDLYLPTLGARQHRREGGLAHLWNSGALALGEYVNLQTAARSHLPGDRDLPDGVKPTTMRHCGGCLPPTRCASYTLRISIYTQ